MRIAIGFAYVWAVGSVLTFVTIGRFVSGLVLAERFWLSALWPCLAIALMVDE